MSIWQMANTEQRESGCSAYQDIFSNCLLNPKRQKEHALQVLEWAVLSRRENFCLGLIEFLHSTFCYRLWFFGWSDSHLSSFFAFRVCVKRISVQAFKVFYQKKKPFKIGIEMRGLISSGFTPGQDLAPVLAHRMQSTERFPCAELWVIASRLERRFLSPTGNVGLAALCLLGSGSCLSFSFLEHKIYGKEELSGFPRSFFPSKTSPASFCSNTSFPRPLVFLG